MEQGETIDWAQSAEDRVLDAAVALAAVHGWSARTVTLAAAEAGLSAADAALLLPHGPRDLAALLSRRHDRAGLNSLAGLDPRDLKVRERIYRGVQARCEASAVDEAATRRCVGFLAMPQNLGLGFRLLWDSADIIWRWAGDTAADENHYSKRVLLGAILGPTLALRLSQGREAADHYAYARIGDVMTFERWKAKLPKADLAVQLAQSLGKLRYGG